MELIYVRSLLRETLLAEEILTSNSMESEWQTSFLSSFSRKFNPLKKGYPFMLGVFWRYVLCEFYEEVPFRINHHYLLDFL